MKTLQQIGFCILAVVIISFIIFVFVPVVFTFIGVVLFYVCICLFYIAGICTIVFVLSLFIGLVGVVIDGFEKLYKYVQKHF